MTILVFQLVNSSRLFVILASEILSRAEVGSSRIIISGFFRNILAIANLCFSHQLNFIHFSQTSVSSQCSNFFTISSILAFLRAFQIFFSLLSPSPERGGVMGGVSNAYSIFSLIVPSKTAGSCGRYQILE